MTQISNPDGLGSFFILFLSKNLGLLLKTYFYLKEVLT